MRDMKKDIKLKFVDFSHGYVPENELLYKTISRHYNVILSDRPDYVISCGLGYDHLRYPDCIKILWTGENIVPDFNFFDYAIGFDHLEFEDRYLRMPLYAFYQDDMNRLVQRGSRGDAEYLDRGFCSFVVTNGGGDPMRRLFFERLSKYKQVASGGRFLNNTSGPVIDKYAFSRKYKFNIAFENSSSSGYVTEKLLQAYAAESVPIYYGDPNVGTDFNVESMVRVSDEKGIERAVAEIIRLDNDDDAYLRMVRAKCLSYENRDMYAEKLDAFLQGIFSKDRGDARKRNCYGYQCGKTRHEAKVLGAYDACLKCGVSAMSCFRKIVSWGGR